MKMFWAGAAAAATLAPLASNAADIRRSAPQPYYTAPAPVAAYSWSGPYLGGNIGYQWGYTTNNPTSPGGVAGGIQAGYNWQTGQFVFGGEADIQLSAAEDTFAPWKFANPWFGTARARAGVALNNILLFGTLGFAFGRGELDSAGISETKTHTGWTAGGGMEVGFTRNWSAKVEYLYVDLAERGYVLTGVGNGFESHLLRFGVNYRF
jgi:outer membrane immunogenic protein